MNSYSSTEYIAVPTDYFASSNETGNHEIFGRSVDFYLGEAEPVAGVVLGGFEYHFGGWYGWGVLEGNRSGYFSVATKNGALISTLYMRNEIVTLERPALAAHNVIKVNKAPADVDFLTGDPDIVEATLLQGRSSTPIIDHVYVYSSGFEGAIGDFNGDMIPNTRDDAVARFMHSIASLNAIYAASGINITARLAYAYESDQPDSFVLSNFNLITINNGIFDELPAVRDLVQADLGNYKRYSGATGSGGMAHGYNGSPTKWMTSGSIGHTVSIGGNSHEIGHNMGMAHGRGSTGASTVFPYGYAYCLSDGNSTLMSGDFSAGCFAGNPVLLQYSNPDINYSVTGEPMGVDFDVDPQNAADGARTHMEAATGTLTYGLGVQDFRTGIPIYPDCDGDEILDIIEIHHGTAQDCNGNGLDDFCDISNGIATDCDFSGIPDSCELGSLTTTVVRSEIAGQVASITFDLSGVPTRRSDIVLNIESTVQCSSTSDWEIFIDNILGGTAFEGTILNNQCGVLNVDSILITNAPADMQELRIEITQGAINDSTGPAPCGGSIGVELAYHVDAANDINRNGVFDACEPGCTPYDISEPHGQLDYFDLQQFNTWYSSGDLRADFAPPYGELNFYDFSAYNMGWQAGCP